MVSDNQPPASDSYDVVILGGAFSGSSLALLLKRKRPQTRILIIEKSTEFDRKVGESTSEVAGRFISKVLGLSNYLSCHHFQKHGLRMWFNREENDCPNCCTELGPLGQSRLPTFQIDRSLLDQRLLEDAVEAGTELLRPATVKSVDLGGDGNNSVTVKHGDSTRTIRGTWVIDCSGRAALVARQRGTLRKLEEHPVHSMWVRFRNVRDLDSHEAHTAAPRLTEGTWTARGNATNHLMGHGWWAWLIPLPNGDFSAGITWDERHFTPPSEGPVGDRIKQHITSTPIGKLMFENAEPIENDARIFKHLPYYSTETTGDGWLLVGDSAGFMDPLYSQGLDFCSFAVSATVGILHNALEGNCVKQALVDHDHDYRLCYHRWFNGLYRDKYEYLGDAEIMLAAYRLDIGAYFVGPVRTIYEDPECGLMHIPFTGFGGLVFGRFMALYNRRLVKIARKRIARGTYGKNNTRHCYVFGHAFSPNLRSFRHIFSGIARWWKLELQHAFIRTPRMDPGSADHQPKEAAATR